MTRQTRQRSLLSLTMSLAIAGCAAVLASTASMADEAL